jgi:hypothetical protein
MKSARRRSRELATQGLYQWLLSAAPAGEIDAQIRTVQGFDKADKAHFDALLHGVIQVKPRRMTAEIEAVPGPARRRTAVAGRARRVAGCHLRTQRTISKSLIVW